MNQITHWLDASNVYGSDDHEADLLRSKSGGKLKVTTMGGEDMLPKCNRFSDLESESEVCHNQPCANDCLAGGVYTIIIFKKMFCFSNL
jgi:hypothetical protein